MNFDLFNDPALETREEICADVIFLRGFALDVENVLLNDINAVIRAAPLRKLFTPSGLPMSVTTTSCGDAGWVSDTYGYRYSKRDAQSHQDWPQMPDSFFQLAQQAAKAAGFDNFAPDSCLINCYKVGAKMSLHQDKDEKDFSQPIVSVSLGLPATFLIGGCRAMTKLLRFH